ncbi:helix-turn-helix domain-containing protein [Hafnia psychrotolerans]|uniref:MDR efflux pump AcrAB transcriptional activator MarA n=1 Tax=Hafnia psychrotolerans TaxID=1477018 RepID=A0ABQ1GJD9_9GAMM|nr:helix-turn-helix domain-containing protein [Hafnia psychrotolerans]GGA44771.1 MDR efflux pump AcrAB transcriptional activator MarA [Hafnia psychrotolerans]
MSARELNQQVIRCVCEWIEDNFDQTLTIAVIAEYCGYSQWHLQKIFKRETGCAIGEYIRNRKLTIIAQRLKDSDESIIYLAERYGFDSQQAFTRTFKKYFSISPYKYRMTSETVEHKYLHPHKCNILY